MELSMRGAGTKMWYHTGYPYSGAGYHAWRRGILRGKIASALFYPSGKYHRRWSQLNGALQRTYGGYAWVVPVGKALMKYCPAQYAQPKNAFEQLNI